uniref:Beta-defensin n=1 Tax=Equus caballus TaxID=9796 RepID=A0A3Q2I5U7_HORSE
GQSLAFWSSGTINHTDLFHYVVRSDLDAGRICGYGTARCQRKCKREDSFIGRCPNMYPCCLKKRNANSSHSLKY